MCTQVLLSHFTTLSEDLKKYSVDCSRAFLATMIWAKLVKAHLEILRIVGAQSKSAVHGVESNWQSCWRHLPAQPEKLYCQVWNCGQLPERHGHFLSSGQHPLFSKNKQTNKILRTKRRVSQVGMSRHSPTPLCKKWTSEKKSFERSSLCLLPCLFGCMWHWFLLNFNGVRFLSHTLPSAKTHTVVSKTE